MGCAALDVERGGVALAGCDQVLDFGDGGDMAAGADGGAVEGRGGASEFKLTLQRPAMQVSIDKTSMENVAGAGGVDRVDPKGGSVVELRAVVGEHAFMAERRSG